MRKHARLIALLTAFATATGPALAQITPIMPTWQVGLEAEATVVALDAREDVGALVATGSWLEAFTPQGSSRWGHAAPAGSQWRDAVLRQDGGAWVLEVASEPSAGVPSRWAMLLHRIGPDGTTRERRPLGTTPYGRPEEQGRLLPSSDDGVVVLSTQPGNFSLVMSYERYDRDGQPLNGAAQDASLRPVLEAMRILPDGGVSYVTRSADSGRIDLKRIDRHGALSGWYAPGDGEHAVIAIEPDGTASALVTSPGRGARRESIDLLGYASAEVAVPALPLDIELKAVSPFIGGRQVAAYRSAGTGHLAVVDRRGRVASSRAFDTGSSAHIVTSALGMLATDEDTRDADAELLSTTDLTTLARFRLTGSARATAGDVTPGMWRMLDSGIVYGVSDMIDAGNVRGPAIARFDVSMPGPCAGPQRPAVASMPRPSTADPRGPGAQVACAPPRPSAAPPASPRSAPVR